MPYEPHSPVHRRPSSRFSVATVWALAGALLGAGSALAQGDAPPRFGEVIEVPLVELELLATGRDGAPIDDLAAGEIRVFEDDVEVKLDGFERRARAANDATSRSGRPPSTSVAPGDGPDRYLAIYLDEVHVGPAGRRRLMADLAAELDRHLAPGDRAMVALYDGSTHVVLPFTHDRKALRATLEDAGALSTARLVADHERQLVLEMIFRDASGEAGNSPCLHVHAIVDGWLQQENNRVDQAIRSFRQFVESLSGIEGRKTILHVSDGIPLRPGAEAQLYAQELCSGEGVAQGQPGAHLAETRDIYDPGSRTLEDTRFDTTRLWREIVARANAGNVTIYTFQAERGPDRFPASADTRVAGQLVGAQAGAVANLQNALLVLADGTGGRAALGGDDLRVEIARALDELQGQYLLTYTPPERPGNELRRIRVEVSRPGIELRHRKLYRPQNLDEQVSHQLTGRLLYGEPNAAGTRGVRLELGEVRRRGGDLVSARFRLGVPLASLDLSETEDGRAGHFSAFIAVAGEDGGTSAVRKAVVPVRVANDPAAPDHFVWEVEILLRTGRQRLGVAVRDELGGTTAFVVRSFDVAARSRAAGG